MKIKVKLDPGIKTPTRAHNTDAGLDLYSPVAIYALACMALIMAGAA